MICGARSTRPRLGPKAGAFRNAPASSANPQGSSRFRQNQRSLARRRLGRGGARALRDLFAGIGRAGSRLLRPVLLFAQTFPRGNVLQPDPANTRFGRTSGPWRQSQEAFIATWHPSPVLGCLGNCQTALYDELHAHLAGDALPTAVGRFAACNQARVPDKAYRERRMRSLGQAPVIAALETAARLERSDAALWRSATSPNLRLLGRLSKDYGATTQARAPRLIPGYSSTGASRSMNVRT